MPPSTNWPKLQRWLVVGKGRLLRRTLSGAAFPFADASGPLQLWRTRISWPSAENASGIFSALHFFWCDIVFHKGDLW